MGQCCPPCVPYLLRRRHGVAQFRLTVSVRRLSPCSQAQVCKYNSQLSSKRGSARSLTRLYSWLGLRLRVGSRLVTGLKAQLFQLNSVFLKAHVGSSRDSTRLRPARLGCGNYARLGSVWFSLVPVTRISVLHPVVPWHFLFRWIFIFFVCALFPL